MIYAAPGATFEAWVDGFPTGQVITIGVRILDNAGGTTTPRTTTTIREFPVGSGRYEKSDLVAPSAAGQYTVYWDIPTKNASEALVVTYTGSVVVPGGADYISAAELKATLGLTGQTFADADVAVAISAASRAVDSSELTGRRFYLDADAAQVRYYTPLRCSRIEIDDLVELTSLTTDYDGDGTYESAWAQNTDFVLEPLNAPADGRPWERIRLHPRSTFRLSGYPRSVKLTGKFGWPSVPPGVKEATTIIATQFLRMAREAPFGVIAIGVDGLAMRIARSDPKVALALAQVMKTQVLA